MQLWRLKKAAKNRDIPWRDLSLNPSQRKERLDADRLEIQLKITRASVPVQLTRKSTRQELLRLACVVAEVAGCEVAGRQVGVGFRVLEF